MTKAGWGALLLPAMLASAQTQPAPRPQMSDQVFKNIQVLKGIPVDEFMNAMGFFSASLGMSCEDCHAANDSKWENFALDTSPRKIMARKMITMVATINKTNFGGRQVLTCYSCHRGSDRPKLTPSLARLYGAGTADEPDDIITQAPNQPSADKILDKYIQALGGAQKLAALTSFTARGTSTGYGPEGKRAIEIYAKAPDQRTTIIHTDYGDNTTAYDGRLGWSAAPLAPLTVMAVTGSDLEGVKLDAQLSFPASIKQALGKWRVGFPATVGDRDLPVIQGTTAGGVLATFYFDPDSGLLARMVRYSSNVFGRVPTQVDYSDYRDVAGVKMPFHWVVTWLDGREDVELTSVQPNAAIDAAKFARPAPPKPPAR